jgi:MFS family permease
MIGQLVSSNGAREREREREREPELTHHLNIRLGYGLGPLLFSPLSEIPQVGRNLPYATTFFLYTLVSIPLALVRNASAFMFLRFLQGFLGSPILATGGASLSDVYSDEYLPFGISAWATACFVAPAFAYVYSKIQLLFRWPRFQKICSKVAGRAGVTWHHPINPFNDWLN